jgi:hypothetical protein
MNKKLKFINAELPVVCSLTQPELGERLAETNEFFKNCAQVVELAEGYAFRFDNPAESLNQILEFIKNERECCQFLRFELVFEPQLGPLWLQLQGSQDAKDFIQATFVKTQA